MYKARPIMAFAAIGQGRAEGKITPEEESVVLGKLLTHWALTSTLEAAAGCASGDTLRHRRHPSRPTRRNDFNHNEEATMAAAMKQGEGDIFGLVSLKSNKNVRSHRSSSSTDPERRSRHRGYSGDRFGGSF